MTAETSSNGDAVEPTLVDAFLEEKLRPPSTRRRWVRRPRLVGALDSATERALTLVAAPAGYGKTTVVAQWISQVDDRAVAWVALDQADNDPVQLWTHIATALARAGCRVDDDAAGFVASNRTEIVDTVLPTIVNALAGAQRIVIILDDFHFVRAQACHEEIDFVIQHLPPSAGMVIITRADPALHLGRLRVSGQLAEIRADQLSFDIDEASILLATAGVRLSDTAISELLDRTEGWPAGMYLATLSLAGRTDPDAFVHRFSGDDRFIVDYLTEEVLARHPADVRRFIISSSILERLSAPLCDFVLETSGSSSTLHDLERSNLFLIPLDPEREWFRFHHLFGVVARAELQAEAPERVSALHDRAAQWYSAHGYVDEALRHALAAGSTSRASQLVQANWIRYVDAGRTATVQGWLRTLQGLEAEADPAALVTAAWMAVLSGDELSLNRFLLLLTSLHDDAPLPDGTRSVESAVAIIRAMAGFGGPVEMLACAERAVELEESGSPVGLAFAHFALGHARYVAGDTSAAISVLTKAAYSSAAPAIIKSFAFAVLSLVEVERRHADRSHDYSAESMKLVESPAMRIMPQASMAFTALGESQAAAGELAEAMVTLGEGLILRRKIPGLSPWPTIHHLLVMGRVAIVANDVPQAELLLDEAEQLMSRFPDGMEAMHARLRAARSALHRRRFPEPIEEPLTGREVDVLRLLQGSMSLAQIASELFLSRNTVKTHAKAIYRKLGATSRSEAVRIGRRRSLI
ncbi:MAG: pknK 2 [Propionibacteriaceae bacterium]|nr:pknK 2 [Propionibacteriaceae bacterium]